MHERLPSGTTNSPQICSPDSRAAQCCTQKLTDTVLFLSGPGEPAGEFCVEEVSVSHSPTHLLSDPHLAASLSCLALWPSPYLQDTTICSEFCHTLYGCTISLRAAEVTSPAGRGGLWTSLELFILAVTPSCQ